MSHVIRFAIVGAGGFARFAATQFVKQAGVQLIGAYDHDPHAIEQLRQIAPDVQAHASLALLLADSSIDLVYIGSPPFLHYAQSLAALRADKHVICEKPAALTEVQARELRALASQRDLLFVVNLMQRYNPLYGAVRELVRRKLLGEFLHGFFENYASDEFLAPGHWFWDEGQSGGIFIEHGVHFFDMFAGWLGAGQVVAAQKFCRPGHKGVWDLAQCTVVYGGHAPVHYYHAFNQPKILDRQEMRLQFERGEITLFEWVPTRLVLNAVCTNEELAELRAVFPGASVEITQRFDGRQPARGRFKSVQFDHKVRLDTGNAATKTELYEGLVRSMFAEQIGWIGDRSLARQIDADNAVESVTVAEKAEQLAVRLA